MVHILLKPLLMVNYSLSITLKNILSLSFFHFKALKDILQHIKLVNWSFGGFVFFLCHEQVKSVFLHEFEI